MSKGYRVGAAVKVKDSKREGTITKDLGKNKVMVCMMDNCEYEEYNINDLEEAEYTY